MKTKEQAEDEFYNLMNDDPDFQAQWGYCEGSQTKINEYDLRVLTKEQAIKKQENAFYEWCSVYDDTKHIKKEKEMTKKSNLIFTRNVKVSGVKRLNNSSNGNPKYEFHFHKGGVVTTPSDAGWVYAFSTDTFWGKWVDITYHMTKAGKAILDSITLNKEDQ